MVEQEWSVGDHASWSDAHESIATILLSIQRQQRCGAVVELDPAVLQEMLQSLTRPVRWSFYDLNFGVDPGGARKDAHFIRGTLDEIKRDLAAEFVGDVGPYLLCWYGARLRLRVFQGEHLVSSIDLHPYVTVHVPGRAPITFAGEGEPIGYNRDDDDWEVFSGPGVSVTVDWDRVHVCSLKGAVVRDDPLCRVRVLPCHGWSHHNVEYGETDFES